MANKWVIKLTKTSVDTYVSNEGSGTTEDINEADLYDLEAAAHEECGLDETPVEIGLYETKVTKMCRREVTSG